MPPGQVSSVSDWLPKVITPNINQLNNNNNSTTIPSSASDGYPFPELSTHRPAPEPTPAASSDSSISTLVSTTDSCSTQSSNHSSFTQASSTGHPVAARKNSHPYARLVVVTPARHNDDVPYYSPNEFTTEPVGLGVDNSARYGISLPNPGLTHQPSSESTQTIRHNSLPQLVTSPTSTPAPINLAPHSSQPDLNRLSPTQLGFDNIQRPQTSPASSSPTLARSGSNYSKLSSPESATSPIDGAGPSPVATSIRASSSRPSDNPVRPSSAGTFSSVSTAGTTGSGGRPWIPDSDGSSSGSVDAAAIPADGDGPEVYRIAPNQQVEFLDPRPEPPGVKLSIRQDDPDQVIIKVVLPGFEVENITVALRRGHKVHIVADSYGENGGHFEKLVSLGTEVSSAQPKAEFDGSTLTVFVARRNRRHQNPVSSPDLVGSPQSSVGSPLMSADRRPSMTTMLESDVAPAFAGTSPARASHDNPRPRSLTGPEGARAAAKAAREEASRRAKEQAKLLPKIGRRFHFKRDKGKESDEGVLSSSPPSASALSPAGISPAGTSPTSIMTTTQLDQPGLSRNDTITAKTRALALSESGSVASSGSGSGSTGPRPKMRGNNLTLRPSSGASFIEAAFKTMTGGHSSDETDTTPSEGGSTPRFERTGMSFTPSH